MPKSSSVFTCQQCGFQSSQYLGRCPECGTWGSLVETIEKNLGNTRTKKVPGKSKIVNINKLENQNMVRFPGGIGELDRVLGGGIVLGSVILISGDPGIGKSTLLTQLAINIPKTLYVAGEESPGQIKIRADRLKPNAGINVLPEIDVDLIAAAISDFKPDLVIVDSIQTLETADLTSPAGSLGQVRESANRLQKTAKSLNIPIVLVGHVTKEGAVAGPRTLEHLVDVVLSMEGDPSSGFRLLRGDKNRFGPTDEVGLFEMEDQGMVEIKNPSKVFLDQKVQAPGSAVVITINGLRPILVEIQALVTKSNLPVPRRVGQGIDNNRLQLLVAVLSKRLGLPLYDCDVFVNATGGIKIIEPAADLGICLAIISSLKNKEIAPKTAFIGEVGLLGELRAVRQTDKRVAEAKNLGFSNVITPENSKNLSNVIKRVLR